MRKILLIILFCVLIIGSCKKKDPIQYELTTSVLPVDGGSVSPSSGLYKEGESVIVTAIPSSEYLFTGWTDGVTVTVNPLTIVMNSNKKITASFEKRKYPLSINTTGEGTVTEEIVQNKSVTEYSSGTVVKLTANPNVGSSFIGWSGDIVSTENPVQLTINGAKSINVNFKKNYYAVKISTVGEGKVVKTMVSGTIIDSLYIHGAVVKMEAQPAWGWKFKGWSGDIKSVEVSYSSSLTGNINATATFEKIYIPQIIYDTSTKNHEWNNGFESSLLSSFNNPYRPMYVSGYTYFDYNSDGIFDIFGRDDNSQDGIFRVHVSINDGKNNWNEVLNVIDQQTFNLYRKIAAADLDNDGDLDMVGFIAEDAGTNIVNPHDWPTGGIDIWRNEKDIFKLEHVVPCTEGYDFFFHSGVLADINHDGWVDIVAGGGPIKIFLNDGTGHFKNEFFEAGFKTGNGEFDFHGETGTADLEAADINNDGYVDILAGYGRDARSYADWHSNFSSYSQTAQIYYGKGSYPFLEGTSYKLPTYYKSESATAQTLTDYYDCTMDFAISDLNNDGFLEILTWNVNANKEGGMSAIELYENNKDGTFKNITISLFDKGENEFLGVGNWFKIWDIDKDGVKEILFEVTPDIGAGRTNNFNGWKKVNGKYVKTILRPVY